MPECRRRIALTGAYGYLGSRIRAGLDRAGWETHALVRHPREGDRAVAWTLGSVPPLPDAVDALVHCAYDFAPRRRGEVWRTNVEGTSLLLDAAVRAGVERIVVLSSMSAYSGTQQIYGQAKLAIEAETLQFGGIAVRPGLVYGDDAGGLVGALLRIGKLRVVPLVGGRSHQFPVLDEDVVRCVIAILERPGWTPEVIGIAQAAPMSFRDVLATLLSRAGLRNRVFVPLPWQPVYWFLRVVEAAGLALPFRADSVLGLVRPAPGVPASCAFPDLPQSLQSLARASHGRTE